MVVEEDEERKRRIKMTEMRMLIAAVAVAARIDLLKKRDIFKKEKFF